MKITELIEELMKCKEKHGDAEVVTYNNAGFVHGTDKLSVYTTGAPFDKINSGDTYIMIHSIEM